MTIEGLHGRHRGEIAEVVGTGPSLLGLGPGDFRGGPVLAINDAVLSLRRLKLQSPIYTLQNDGCLAEPQEPEILVVSRSTPVHKRSDHCFLAYPHRVLIDRDVDLAPHGKLFWSVSHAVVLAYLMGCRGLRMLGHDGYTDLDTRRVVDGAVEVRRPLRYYMAGQNADRLARSLGLEVEWVKADGTVLALQDSGRPGRFRNTKYPALRLTIDEHTFKFVGGRLGVSRGDLADLVRMHAMMHPEAGIQEETEE